MAVERTVSKEGDSKSEVFDGHFKPKNEGLQKKWEDMKQKVDQMRNLIGEEEDTFAKKAEMFYVKKPDLEGLVKDFYKNYTSLLLDYDGVILRRSIKSGGSCISDVSSEMEAKLRAEIEKLKSGTAEKNDRIEALNRRFDSLKLNYETLLKANKDALDAKNVTYAAEMSTHLHQLHMEHGVLIARADKQVRQAVIGQTIEHFRNGYHRLRLAVIGQMIEHFRNGYRRLRQAVIGQTIEHFGRLRQAVIGQKPVMAS